MATYDEREKSVRAGEPIEYVRFTLGEEVFRYTTSPINEFLFSEEYQALDFKRSSPQLSPELAQNQLTISMPRNIDLPAKFQTSSPRQMIYIIIYRKHRGEADSASISYWQGGVDGIGFKGETAEIVCSSLETLLERGGLRYRFMNRCRFYFCDGRCPVPPSAVTEEVIIDIANLNRLSAPDFGSFPDGYFKYGEITTPELESRFIIDHVGDTITLIAPFSESPETKLCKVLPGCDYTPEMCSSKWGMYTDNGRDCGCFDSIPVENIFEKGVR